MTAPYACASLSWRACARDRLLNHRSARYGPFSVSGAKAFQTVTVIDKEGEETQFLWVLSRQRHGELKDCWMTDAVISAQNRVPRQLVRQTGKEINGWFSIGAGFGNLAAVRLKWDGLIRPPPSSRPASTRPRGHTAGIAMLQSQASILVKIPPQQVYDFVVVGFSGNYRRWSPEVQRLEILTPGPLRVGSRARQVRVDQGRRSENTFRVVALEPPSKVRFHESSDQFRTEYRMEPMGDETRLTFVFELRRMELYMRPFEKLIRAALQDGAERVVRNIKRLVERESSPPTSRRA